MSFTQTVFFINFINAARCKLVSAWLVWQSWRHSENAASVQFVRLLHEASCQSLSKTNRGLFYRAGDVVGRLTSGLTMGFLCYETGTLLTGVHHHGNCCCSGNLIRSWFCSIEERISSNGPLTGQSIHCKISLFFLNLCFGKIIYSKQRLMGALESRTCCSEDMKVLFWLMF